jgi:DNA-binding PadR family transcriptional regulator
MVKVGFIETDAKDLWPLKKLDEVLKYLLAANQPMHRTFTEIQKELPFETDSKDLYEILGKLEKDGYIDSEIRESNQIKEYRSTFDGRYFITETGGYLEKNQKDYQIRKKVKDDASYQLKYQSRSLIAIAAAGVGTCGLLIWEILKKVFCW